MDRKRANLLPLSAMCKCGHPLEEHDWGAYDNPNTEWEPACLVEECSCSHFEPITPSITNEDDKKGGVK